MNNTILRQTRNLIGSLNALKTYPAKVIPSGGTISRINDENIKLLPKNVKYLHSYDDIGERFKLVNDHIIIKCIFYQGN